MINMSSMGGTGAGADCSDGVCGYGWRVASSHSLHPVGTVLRVLSGPSFSLFLSNLRYSSGPPQAKKPRWHFPALKGTSAVLWKLSHKDSAVARTKQKGRACSRGALSLSRLSMCLLASELRVVVTVCRTAVPGAAGRGFPGCCAVWISCWTRCSHRQFLLFQDILDFNWILRGKRPHTLFSAQLPGTSSQKTGVQ